MTSVDTAAAASSTSPRRTLDLGGVRVELCGPARVLSAVERQVLGDPARPLAIGSVNLDHVHHFGARGRSGALGERDVDWMMLLDGAPLARRARQLTGLPWPRLAGADMLRPLLEQAAALDQRVGFVGGWEHTHRALGHRLARELPGLDVAGFWCPSRHEVLDHRAAHGMARDLARARPDVLVVGLGKPRQEQWIERHASATGAKVLLAFGAAAEFLAGTSRRAPAWMRAAGLEWSYRLARDPRRLARRYCIDGPRALGELYSVTPTGSAPPVPGPSRRS